MSGWDIVSWLAGYTSVAMFALYLQDRSHQREIVKIIQLYEQQSNYQSLMIEQLKRALDALKKAQL